MQPRMLDIEMKCDDLAQHLIGSTANASEPGVPVHPLQRVGIGETAGAEYLEYLVDGRAAGTRRDEFGRRDLMVPEECAADRFAGPVEQCRGCLYVGPAIGKPVPQCLVIEKPLAECCPLPHVGHGQAEGISGACDQAGRCGDALEIKHLEYEEHAVARPADDGIFGKIHVEFDGRGVCGADAKGIEEALDPDSVSIQRHQEEREFLSVPGGPGQHEGMRSAAGVRGIAFRASQVPS